VARDVSDEAVSGQKVVDRSQACYVRSSIGAYKAEWLWFALHVDQSETLRKR